MKFFVLAATLALASLNAVAAPISATNLGNNVVTAGSVADGNFDSTNAAYFTFFSAGGNVTVDGSRIDGGLDMGFWIFSGQIADTAHFGAAIDNADPGFVAFRDDEHAPAVPGPFGDPFFSGILAAGWYTVVVVDVLGNGNTGANQVYDFNLVANGVRNVPEPMTLGLLGLGLIGVVATRRRS